MHCQPDFVLVVFIEACRYSDTHTELFGESDALDQCLQYDFDPLRSRGHPADRIHSQDVYGSTAPADKSIPRMKLEVLQNRILSHPQGQV